MPRELSGEHWILIAGFLSVVGAQLAAADDSWHHLAKPGFWAGLFGQVALLLRAMYSKRPERTTEPPPPPDESDDDYEIGI